MATLYASPRLGRAVIQMEDGTHYLLDVEKKETAIECPPTFLQILSATAPDLSQQLTNEEPPFPIAYENLLLSWQQERVSSMVLLALDSKMPGDLRSTAGELANDLLSNPDNLVAARNRLLSAPLSEEADFEGAPSDGPVLISFLAFLRDRQDPVHLATESWARARINIAEFSTWAAELRERTVSLGGFLAMTDALTSQDSSVFDSWLHEILGGHDQEASSDFLRILLAWKEEALALLEFPQGEDDASLPTPATGPEIPAGAATPKATPQSPEPASIEEFGEVLRTGALTPEEILSKFVELAPDWLLRISAEQTRPLADLVHDLIRSGPINLAGISELAHQQHFFPDLREVWVFAPRPLDLEETFYSIVRHNVGERFVKYYYFLSDVGFFGELRTRLIRDLADQTHVDKHIHYIEVPDIAFLGNPGIGIMIPGDIEKMHGVHVTSIAEDGTIIEAQDLTDSELRRNYIMLRRYIEEKFDRKLPRLPGEPGVAAQREGSDKEAEDSSSIQ